MKLKRLPEDFQVEEQTSLAVGGGPFALYRLTKQSLGTLEAIDAVGRRWKLPPRAVGFAGLKDKHAQTTQHVTIRGGPRRNLSQTNLTLEYLGQAARPIHASDIIANRFSIVIRDLSPEEVQRATEALAAIKRDGLPSYFDNQRFGSLGQSAEFIARPWCLGDYQRALWLALADPNVHDRPRDQKEKQAIRDHWGNWPACVHLVADPQRQTMIRFLADHPVDYRRAIALFPQELRSIWLAAFQSDLWNQVLAALIRNVCGARSLPTHRIARHDLPFLAELDDDQRRQLQTTMLPLPSARLHLDGHSLEPLYHQALAAEGLELRQIRVKYPRDSFFSKGERPAVVWPGDFQDEAAGDEYYDGARKLVLRFSLPRGAYATLLIKRIAGDLPDDEAGDD